MGSAVQSVFENKDESTDLIALIDGQKDNFEVESTVGISNCSAQDIKICSNAEIEISSFEQAVKNEQQQENEGVEVRVADSLHLIAVPQKSQQESQVIISEDMATSLDLEQDKDVVLGQENKEGESKLEVEMITGDKRTGQEIEMLVPMKKEVDLSQENKEESNENTVVDIKKEKEIPLCDEQVTLGQEDEDTSDHEVNMITNEIEKETITFDVNTTTSGDVGQETMEKQETKMTTDEKEQEMEMYTEDINENWEDLDSDIAQETLSYMKMTLATKLPQHHELEAAGGKEQSWREGTLIQRNLYALVTAYKSDCSFHIRDGDELWVFPCHVLPLSWASSKLENMLEETKTHELLDVEPRHFLKLLEFVYTDATTLDNIDTAFGVWSVANKLGVKSLASYCAFLVRKQMTAKDVCQVLEFARYSGDPKIEKFCIKFIREHTSAVLSVETWSKISRDTLETILSQDELNCTSELELFRACVRWVTASSPDQNAREVLGSVLGLIRFRTFSTRDFATFVCPTKLLTGDEQSDIFCSLATNSAKMPAGFSSNPKSRGICTEVKSSVSVAIGTSDFDDIIRPASTLPTELSQPEPSGTLSAEYGQLGVATTLSAECSQLGVNSWLSAEYSQPGCSTSNVSYAEALRENSVESYSSKGSNQSNHIDSKNKVKVMSQPVVQGKLEDLKRNGYIGKTHVIKLLYTGEPENEQNGHFILNNPISFSVSISTYITSVDLLSWQIFDTKFANQARYKECVLVILKSSSGNTVAQGKFENMTSQQKIYKVKFFRPFCLNPNVIYKLYLEFDDLDLFHCGYPLAKNKVYTTSWGLQVKILNCSSSQLRGIEFAEIRK